MRSFFWVLLLVSVSLTTVFAQQTSPPQRDPRALSILAQSLSKMGEIASPSRMTLAQGTITYPDGQQKPVKMETIGTDHLRNDVGSGEFSFVSAGGRGFLLIEGKKHTLKFWITQYKRPEHLPALSLISELQNPRLAVKYLGIEQVNGIPAHHIRLSMLPSDGTPVQFEDLVSEFHVYVDQASLLVVRTRSFNFSPEALQNRSPVDTFFSDYRLQDGAMVPFHLARWVDGQKDCEIAFSSISLSASVPMTDFQ